MRYFVVNRWPDGRLYVAAEVVTNPDLGQYLQPDAFADEVGDCDTIQGGNGHFTAEELELIEGGGAALAAWHAGDDSAHHTGLVAEYERYKAEHPEEVNA